MKRVILSLILSILAFFSQVALANNGGPHAAPQPATVNQVKLELLGKLTADGYLIAYGLIQVIFIICMLCFHGRSKTKPAKAKPRKWD